ncbi:MAG: inositol monophosphatase family protein [Pseudomonadota bacterium]
MIAKVAEEEILPRFGKLSPEEVREKSSPNDLVTLADEAAERRLQVALKEIAPSAGFIGEELATKDPSAFDALERDDAVWIVDPLDGTRNFVRGNAEFGSIVAYVKGGKTLFGWIYAALERKCAIAASGEGVSWDGAPVSVAPKRAGAPNGLRSVGWLTPDWRDRIIGNLKQSFETSATHCSAFAYLKTLRGEADFKLSSRLYPWDHAAGVLMVEEAGGAATYLDDDAAFSVGRPEDRPLLVSAAGRDHAAFIRVLTANAPSAEHQ